MIIVTLLHKIIGLSSLEAVLITSKIDDIVDSKSKSVCKVEFLMEKFMVVSIISMPSVS